MPERHSSRFNGTVVELNHYGTVEIEFKFQCLTGIPPRRDGGGSALPAGDGLSVSMPERHSSLLQLGVGGTIVWEYWFQCLSGIPRRRDRTRHSTTSPS